MLRIEAADTYATGQSQVTISLIINELMKRGGHMIVTTIAETKKNAAVVFPTRYRVFESRLLRRLRRVVPLSRRNIVSRICC